MNQSLCDNSEEDPDVIAALAMSLITGVGPRLQATLLEQFGTAQSVLQQPAAVLRTVNGIGSQIADRIAAGEHWDTAKEMLVRCRELRVGLRRKHTPGYPAGLNAVSDAPGLLYVRGTLEARDELAVAIVGSRRCTTYGRRQAERLAGSLVRAGFSIISGLARGIDGAAHRGALNAGGRTVAVMATGVKEIYPPEHADLAIEITRSGALVSEFPLDQKPRPGLFPQRNRIISGLADAVLVVEATERSGSLITARLAAEQGRDVFAVPGNVLSGTHDGCHRLLRDGAALVCSPDEVLALLTQTGTWQPPTPAEPAPTRDASSTPDLADSLQRHIWQLCRREPSTVDELLTLVDQPTPAVLRALVHLELAGLLVVDGDCYSAVYAGT